MNRFQVRGIVVGVVLAAVLSMIASPAAATPGSEDDSGNPVHRYNATLATTLFRSVFNGGDTVAAEGLISPDATIHTPYGEFSGPAGLQDYLAIVQREYPDAWFEITAIDINGDTVVVHWAMTASRYIRPSSPPVNVRVSSPGVTTITVADGEIDEVIQTQQDAAITGDNEVGVTYGPLE